MHDSAPTRIVNKFKLAVGDQAVDFNDIVFVWVESSHLHPDLKRGRQHKPPDVNNKQKTHLAVNPNQRVSDLWTSAGWHGFEGL